MILFLGGIGKMISSAVNVVSKTVAQGASALGGALAKGGLGGIVDTFAKIGGGGGGIFGMVGGLIGGPVGAIAGNILGSMVGGGTLPLPKGGALGGLLGGPGGLGGLIGKGLEALQSFAGKLGEKLTGGLNLINQIFDKLGIKPPQFPTITGGTCFPQLPGGFPFPQQGGIHIHVHVGGPAPPGGTPGTPGGTGAPGGTPGTTAPPPGVGTGGTSQTGGTGGTTPKSGDPLMQAAEKGYDQMASIEKELANLDPNAPDYQKKLMQLQQKMQRMQELLSMINQAFKQRHEINEQFIRNMA